MRLLDNTTEASLPGGLEISLEKYRLYYGYTVSRFWFETMWDITRRVPWLKKKAYVYMHTKEKFMYGCLNPAVVIDKSKGTIAVLTDLAASVDIPRYVVRIQQEQLRLIDGYENIQNGARFASVATYSANHESQNDGYWDNFYPTIIDCLVNDPKQCQKALNKIGESLWNELDRGLRQIPQKEKNGLYRVEL